MFQDLRLALRSLVRQPGFTALAVFTLALGVGSTAAIFSVVDHVVLRPMPYPDGDRMVYVRLSAPKMGLVVTPSLALARRIEAEVPDLGRIEFYEIESQVTDGPDGAEPIRVVHARPGLFPFLGGRPRLGRTLSDADMLPGAPPAVVISHKLWRTRFAGSNDVLAQDIRLDGVLHRIVGVMGPGFRTPGGRDDAYAPLVADPRTPDTSRRVTVMTLRPEDGTADLMTSALKPRVSPFTAEDRLLQRGFEPAVIDPSLFQNQTLRRSALILFGAVSLLLLIGCANVAALLLTRNSARSRELAIRRALGASRPRLVRLLLLEAFAIAAMAGAAGSLLAMWALEIFVALLPDNLASIESMRVDTRVLGFAAAVSLLTGFLFGLLPAFQGTRQDLTEAMRGDARTGGATRAKNRTRRLLTAAEVALALMLLVGAGLLIRSFVQLRHVPLGFDPAGTLSVSLHLPDSRYTDEQRRAFFDKLVEEASSLPGVTAVSRATMLPPAGGLMFGQIQVEGRPADAPELPETFTGSTVSNNYVDLMRMQLRAGRTFGPEDTMNSTPVVLINETMATKLWPGENPLGKRISLSPPGPKMRWLTVVGVLGDVKTAGLRELGGHADYQIYQTDRQETFERGAIVLRTAGDPKALAAPLRARIAKMDPMLPVTDLRTGDERIAEEMAGERFNLLLLLMFSSIGLLLAATGIYGVMALYVTQRQHEIGVRLALGASARSLTWLVMGQSLMMTAAGAAAGTIGALWLTRLMGKMLYEVAPNDPMTFGIVTVVVMLVAVLSTLLPVRRAVRVSPAIALRAN